MDLKKDRKSTRHGQLQIVIKNFKNKNLLFDGGLLSSKGFEHTQSNLIRVSSNFHLT